MEIERTNTVICFADVCPSELFHNGSSTHLAFALVNFVHIEKPALKHIRQFKDTRGLERRSKAMDYLIAEIEKGAIRLIVEGYCTHKDVAFENGKNFLTAYNFIDKYETVEHRVLINGIDTSVGQLVSLAFYSIILSVFAREVASFVRYEKKTQGIVMLDLLPGDNQENSRQKLDLVRFLINNSEMKGLIDQSIKENKIARVGFGYGTKNNNTREFKNDFELVITDWIVQSLYSLFSKDLTKDDEELKRNFELSKLANFLRQSGKLNVIPPMKLRFS